MDWRTVSTTALQQGDWKKSLDHLTRSQESAGEDVEYWKLLCCSYLQAGQWTEVSNVAAIGSQKYADEAIFLECWAWAEHLLGETEAALKLLESREACFGARESFVYTLACLYASLQRLGEAKRCLANAQKLSPDRNSFLQKVTHQRELRILWREDEMALAC